MVKAVDFDANQLKYDEDKRKNTYGGEFLGCGYGDAGTPVSFQAGVVNDLLTMPFGIETSEEGKVSFKLNVGKEVDASASEKAVRAVVDAIEAKTCQTVASMENKAVEQVMPFLNPLLKPAAKEGYPDCVRVYVNKEGPRKTTVTLASLVDGRIVKEPGTFGDVEQKQRYQVIVDVCLKGGVYFLKKRGGGNEFGHSLLAKEIVVFRSQSSSSSGIDFDDYPVVCGKRDREEEDDGAASNCVA